jgi:hypothetical protein
MDGFPWIDLSWIDLSWAYPWINPWREWDDEKMDKSMA